MDAGFRWHNFYGSFHLTDEFCGVGFEFGALRVPSLDDSYEALTVSIVFKLATAEIAFGYIVDEYEGE